MDLHIKQSESDEDPHEGPPPVNRHRLGHGHGHGQDDDDSTYEDDNKGNADVNAENNQAADAAWPNPPRAAAGVAHAHGSSNAHAHGSTRNPKRRKSHRASHHGSSSHTHSQRHDHGREHGHRRHQQRQQSTSGSAKDDKQGTEDRNKSEDNTVADGSPLDALLQRLRNYYKEQANTNISANADNNTDNAPRPLVDVRMARYLLEACSGSVSMAAALYIDDILESDLANAGAHAARGGPDHDHDNDTKQERRGHHHSASAATAEHRRDRNKSPSSSSKERACAAAASSIAAAARADGSTSRAAQQQQQKQPPPQNDTSGRKVRRRLEQQFAGVNQPEDQNVDAVQPVIARNEHNNMENEENNNNIDNAVNEIMAPPAEPVAQQEEQEQAQAPENNNINNNINNGESVSVSDDELAATAGLRRIGSLDDEDDNEHEQPSIRSRDRTRFIVAQAAARRRSRQPRAERNGPLPRRNIDNNNVDGRPRWQQQHVSDNGGVSEEEGEQSEGEKDGKPLAATETQKDKKQGDNNNVASKLDSDSGEDEDWLWDDENEVSLTVESPLEELWGSSSDSCLNEQHADAQGDGGTESRTNNNKVIADDEPAAEGSDSFPSNGIPHTWLNAGFTMSPCGTGLLLKSPPDEEVALLRWRQQSQRSRGGGGPPKKHNLPPYHCKGISALFSTVTALLYTGASIQGNEVSCTSARKPFISLTEKERLQEFESRLVDALSALLYVAVQASIDRKKKLIQKGAKATKKKESDVEKMRQQRIRRRLGLCPTCRWEEDGNTGEAPFPEGRDAGKNIRVSTSFSSIHGIRSYVLSNMRSFTTRGGCALFLETVMRIHGKSCVVRMIRRAREKQAADGTAEADAADSRKKVESSALLVSCTCEQQQKTQPKNGGDPSCGQHECVSTELVSLLLSGQVHTSLRGWNTGGLGLGLLTNQAGEVGNALMRPAERPVWIVRVDSFYSVLWVDGNKESVGAITHIDQLDSPGTLFYLTHWNCWYGDRQKSGMRVITARGEWVPPIESKAGFGNNTRKRSVMESIIDRRSMNLKRNNIVSSDELEEAASKDKRSVVANEEIDSLNIHTKDMTYYPGEFRRWRYEFHSNADVKGECDADKKLSPEKSSDEGSREENWVPYFRLCRRQKLVVEMKLAANINRILWTRWPRATVDTFTPSEEPPTVVL